MMSLRLLTSQPSRRGTDVGADAGGRGNDGVAAADGELIGGGELIQYDAADMGCASTARQMTYRHLCNVGGGPGTGPQRELL